MRWAIAVVVVALLAVGAGWAAIEVDGATTAEAGRANGTAITPVLSVRRTPRGLLEDRRRQTVAAAAQSVVPRAPGEFCLMVTEEGRGLFAHDALKPLTPASTQKLLVGAALLQVMDPNEPFRTVAVAETEPANGVVDGDLTIVGGGDPLLATDAYIARQTDPEKPATRFEDLADAIVAAGITHIQGSVVGDGSRYDNVRDVPTWLPQYREQVAAGPLSGLGVNDGLESFTETEVAAYPGRPAADPPAHTAGVMAGLLHERGIIIDGGAHSGAAPENATEVASIDSPPARIVVGQMLRYSDNTTAELLTKEIAVRNEGPGTTQDGVAAIAALLAENDVETGLLHLNDGSGLDVGNRINCLALTQVLDAAGPDSPLAEGLAAPGQPGTLRGRMADTPAQGTLRAKTGSLRHVGALAGFVEAADGHTYTFAYIDNVAQGEFIPPEDADAQEALVVALATVPQVQPPPEILPAEPQAISTAMG